MFKAGRQPSISGNGESNVQKRAYGGGDTPRKASPLQEIPELLFREARVANNPSHSEGVDGIVAGNRKKGASP